MMTERCSSSDFPSEDADAEAEEPVNMDKFSAIANIHPFLNVMREKLSSWSECLMLWKLVLMEMTKSFCRTL